MTFKKRPIVPNHVTIAYMAKPYGHPQEDHKGDNLTVKKYKFFNKKEPLKMLDFCIEVEYPLTKIEDILPFIDKNFKSLIKYYLPSRHGDINKFIEQRNKNYSLRKQLIKAMEE